MDDKDGDFFKEIKKGAEREFTEKLYDLGRKTGHTDVERAQADEVKKMAEAELQKLEKARQSEREQELTRLWGLTPPSLKLLLPGRGTIKNQFGAQYLRCA